MLLSSYGTPNNDLTSNITCFLVGFWNLHTWQIFTLLGLSSFTQPMLARFTQADVCNSVWLLSLLFGTSLYTQNTVYSCILLLMNIWLVFIYHLNNFTINILVHVFWSPDVCISIGMHLRVELVGHGIYIYSSLICSIKQYSNCVIPIYTPTSTVWELPLFNILANLFWGLCGSS